MKFLFIIFFIIFLGPSIVLADRNISFLIIDADSFLVNKAVQNLKSPNGVKIQYFTYEDLCNEPSSRAFVESSRVIIVDVMMAELNQYLIKNNLVKNKKIYALRGSRDDEALKKKGFIFNEKVNEYFKHLHVENIKNLILCVTHMEIDQSIEFGRVIKQPLYGIYHPKARLKFTAFKPYFNWYETRPDFNESSPWIGLMFYSSSLIPGQVEATDIIISKLEKSGFNVLPCFGKVKYVLKKFLLDEDQKSRVDIALTFSMKFYSAIDDEIKKAISNLNVPIINAINLYSIPLNKWETDPVGIPPLEVSWSVATPEISSMIEPTPLLGKIKKMDNQSLKQVYVHKVINKNFDHLILRLKKWISLKKMKNSKKRLAVLFYNHSQGKQNIGASYLNVFKSLETILGRLAKEGYSIKSDRLLDENAIKNLILKTGRNIGSWAPGELESMLIEKNIIRLKVSEYKKWFEKLPEDFKTKVIKQWGEIESSSIMIKDNAFIIPAVMLENIVLMPEPARGWSDEPMKLYHDPLLYPHHQYIAAYLWIKNKFNADAMIHLGTHATHEWLPGKQAGLLFSCPPEVLITDIPNIYPYIVDDVGEGIQAKRRGRGVIIDHLIPPLKKAGLYHEYDALHKAVHQYVQAKSIGSLTTQKYFKNIVSIVNETGIAKDIGIENTNKPAHELMVEKIHLYLHEIEGSILPYGLHTFGLSPGNEAIQDTADLIVQKNSSARLPLVKKNLLLSAQREMDHLVKALNGGYIPPGEGNDPIKNLNAIPTGKNFYGFHPQKIPSPAAWELGREAAQKIIQNKKNKHGKYPQKVAVVLWATETIRNEGINECTILYLMGLSPVWDQSGRVKGTKVIPAARLKRPRIDVLINPSGLYRDLFPDKLLFLDKAVQKAAAQKDIENFIFKNTQKIESNLIMAGMNIKKAKTLSKCRIFTEKPGSYGNGVSEMTSASGFWDSDNEIASVFENRTGFVFGMGKWGEEAKMLLKENLKEVDVAVHSISSNLYGVMDNDDMFQYLGGLTLAAKKNSGTNLDTLISLQRDPGKIKVESIEKTIGRELRTRYLNPEWIQGMKKENYAGAREMAKFVEYMWGWQVTIPDAIDKTAWEQTLQVYVEDKYHQDMKEFFNKHNPWAYQSITARMLEAIRKGYWKADEKTKQKLAFEYAQNVVAKGVACCDHTCNNPVLNQMVVNILSIPGIISPKIVTEFKIAIEKSAATSLDEQVKKRDQVKKELTRGFEKKNKKEPAMETNAEQNNETEIVEGFKMEQIQTDDKTSHISSSGIQWFASFFILLVIGLFVFGIQRKIS